jgi:hypothetical protein
MSHTPSRAGVGRGARALVLLVLLVLMVAPALAAPALARPNPPAAASQPPAPLAARPIAPPPVSGAAPRAAPTVATVLVSRAASVPSPTRGKRRGHAPSLKAPLRWPLAALDRANAEARDGPSSGAFVNSALYHPFESGRLYVIHTSPRFLTTITLKPGEKLIAKAAGDTVRWVLGETEAGSGETVQVIDLRQADPRRPAHQHRPDHRPADLPHRRGQHGGGGLYQRAELELSAGPARAKPPRGAREPQAVVKRFRPPPSVVADAIPIERLEFPLPDGAGEGARPVLAAGPGLR